MSGETLPSSLSRIDGCERKGPKRVCLGTALSLKTMSEHHPSALRNRGPIVEQLKKFFSEFKILPTEAKPTLLALEAASGTGAHLEVFASAFPKIEWIPSEYVVSDELAAGDIGRIGTRDGDVLSVLDTFGSKKFENVKPAVALDLSKPFHEWPGLIISNAGNFDAVFASNVTHITPVACTHGLIEASGTILRDGGLLCIYGPFKVGGSFTGDGGNERFDQSLKERNPAWGYRDVEFIESVAVRHGLVLRKCIDMPANNFMLCLRKEKAKAAN